jgi:hypothetical protein
VSESVGCHRLSGLLCDGVAHQITIDVHTEASGFIPVYVPGLFAADSSGTHTRTCPLPAGSVGGDY